MNSVSEFKKILTELLTIPKRNRILQIELDLIR